MEMKLTKNQERRVNYHIKRTEKKLEEIKKKHHIREDTSSVDEYILQRTLVITAMKAMTRDMFYNFIRYNDIFPNTEYSKLSNPIRELHDKLEEADNKLEDIYERVILSKRWEKWNCRDLTNQD